MTTITDDERDMILHALGLTKCGGKMPRWSSRNRLVTDPDCADGREARSLCDRGLMRSRSLDPRIWQGMVLYTVTAEGCRSAGVSARTRKEDVR